MKENKLSGIIIAGVSVMLVISSTALLHANEAEFILDRFNGVGSFEFSLFDTLLYASYLIFGPVIAFLGSRGVKRKSLIITGAVATALITMLMPLCREYPLLLTLRFFQGAFCVSSWQTLMTLSLDLSCSGNRGRNMGIFGTFMALAMGLGPVTGGLLASLNTFAPYYAASLQCLTAAALAALFIKEPETAVRSKRPGLIESVFYAVKRPPVMIPSLFNFVDRLHMGFIIFVLPLLVRDILNLGPEIRGMLLGINGSAFILLQFPIGRLSDKRGRLPFLVTGSLGYGLLLCLTGFAAESGLLFLSLLFFGLGIFSGFTGPSNAALLGDIAEEGENPLAMGFFNLSGNVGMVCGSLVGGSLLSVMSFKNAFIIAGMIELLSLCFNFILLKKASLLQPHKKHHNTEP